MKPVSREAKKLMGEAEIREVQRKAFMERVLGDAQPFDCYVASGCPKCGGPSAGFRVSYCFGKQMLDPDAAKRCPVLGQHLHRFCACGHGWLERCKDYVPE